MNRFTKKVLAATGTVAVGAVLALGAAAPAQAALSDCSSGRFCLWNYNDQNQYLYGNAGNASYVGSGANDRASSIFNNGNSCTTRFYEDQSYGGRYGDISRKNSYNKLSSWFISPIDTWDDRISSFYWMC